MSEKAKVVEMDAEVRFKSKVLLSHENTVTYAVLLMYSEMRRKRNRENTEEGIVCSYCCAQASPSSGIYSMRFPLRLGWLEEFKGTFGDFSLFCFIF